MKSRRALMREYPVVVTFRFRSEEERFTYAEKTAKAKGVRVANVHGEAGLGATASNVVFVEVESPEQRKLLRELDRKIAAYRAKYGAP